MIGPGGARELLLVEALGDAAKLLDRVEGVSDVIKALHLARKDVEQAGLRLQSQAAALEKRMGAVAERVQTDSVKVIAHRADQHAREVVGWETQEMRKAARTVFDDELKSALQRLSHFIESRIDQRILRREWWISVGIGANVVVLTHVLTICFEHLWRLW